LSTRSLVPTAQHSLFAEQIRFGFFRERRFEDSAARAADSMAIGERLRERIAGGILIHRDQRWHAAALLILAPHQIARDPWARSTPRRDPCGA
jgi:hypothetical protein